MKYHIDFDLDFKRNTYPGLYVVFEGINTSGKTTQVERVKNYFESQGKDVITTSEPNEIFPTGKLVREILNGKQVVPPAALQYLYTADRIINHESLIVPALKAGKIVLSSRSFWSAVVYGILDKGADYTRPDADLILSAQGILSMYHRFLVPNVTFYLDISVDTVMDRMAEMGKPRDMYEEREKLSRLIAGYHWVVEQFKAEFVMIKGEQSITEVTEDIVKKLHEAYEG